MVERKGGDHMGLCFLSQAGLAKKSGTSCGVHPRFPSPSFFEPQPVMVGFYPCAVLSPIALGTAGPVANLSTRFPTGLDCWFA